MQVFFFKLVTKFIIQPVTVQRNNKEIKTIFQYKLRVITTNIIT